MCDRVGSASRILSHVERPLSLMYHLFYSFGFNDMLMQYFISVHSFSLNLVQRSCSLLTWIRFLQGRGELLYISTSVVKFYFLEWVERRDLSVDRRGQKISALILMRAGDHTWLQWREVASLVGTTVVKCSHKARVNQCAGSWPTSCPLSPLV